MFFLKDYEGSMPEYVVLIDVDPAKKFGGNGGKPYTAVCGYSRTLEGTEAVKRDHVTSLGETFGGLVEKSCIGKYKFRVQKASWTDT